MDWAGTVKMGPNDANRVVWALGEYFFYFFFIFLNTTVIHRLMKHHVTEKHQTLFA